MFYEYMTPPPWPLFPLAQSSSPPAPPNTPLPKNLFCQKNVFEDLAGSRQADHLEYMNLKTNFEINCKSEQDLIKPYFS